MSLFKDELAALKPGTRIRATRSNGDVVEGVILRNDSADALSVRVSCVSVLRYDGISAFEVSGTGTQPVYETVDEEGQSEQNRKESITEKKSESTVEAAVNSGQEDPVHIVIQEQAAEENEAVFQPDRSADEPPEQAVTDEEEQCKEEPDTEPEVPDTEDTANEPEEKRETEQYKKTELPTRAKNELQGILISYNYAREWGSIIAPNGKEYFYSPGNVNDADLRNILPYIERDHIFTIPVTFQPYMNGGQHCAGGISVASKEFFPSIEGKKITFKDKAEDMYCAGRYGEAIYVYKKVLANSSNFNDYLANRVINCYLSLYNELKTERFLTQASEFFDKNKSRFKDLEIVEKIAEKFDRNGAPEKAVKIYDFIFDKKKDSPGTQIHCLIEQERIYRRTGDLESAERCLQDWLKIVEKKKLTVRDDMISKTYAELAEVQFERGRYEAAEDSCSKSREEKRIRKIMEKLKDIDRAPAVPKSTPVVDLSAFGAELSAFSEEYEESELYELNEVSDESEEEFPVPDISLDEAFAAYEDSGSFADLGLTDKDVIDRIFSFRPDQLYCMLTYSAAADRVASLHRGSSASLLNSQFTQEGAVSAVARAVALAFDSPFDDGGAANDILTCSDHSSQLIPELHPSLFASAALRMLFEETEDPANIMNDMVQILDFYDDYESMPQVITAARLILDYRSTGTVIDSMAGYRRSVVTPEAAAGKVKDFCKDVSERIKAGDSNPQVTALRVLVFENEKSDMYALLRHAASNEVSKAADISRKVGEMFIRKGKSISADNIDNRSLDDYIDEHWEISRGGMLWHDSRMKFLGSKRLTFRNLLVEGIECLCGWIEAASLASDSNLEYCRRRYDETAPKLTETLSELEELCSERIKSRGFDWGTESLRLTANELRRKLNGSYDVNEKKYMFVPFLRSGDVLLDNGFIPEISSTFSGLGNMNILSRIDRHANAVLPELEDRVEELFENDLTRSNLRTAALIKEYAEKKELRALSESSSFKYLQSCLEYGVKRMGQLYKDFCGGLELAESCGRLSAAKGEKRGLLSIVEAWYNISALTGDYGFFALLIKELEGRAEKLYDANKKNYLLKLRNEAERYGLSDETAAAAEDMAVEGDITSAEAFTAAVLRGDDSSPSDDADEAAGYFSDFLACYDNCFALTVEDPGEDNCCMLAESGFSTMEELLTELGASSGEQAAGGARLIECFGENLFSDQNSLVQLLEQLGFGRCRVTEEGAGQFRVIPESMDKFLGVPVFGADYTEVFRVLIIDKQCTARQLNVIFRRLDETPVNTVVLLNCALELAERRDLARIVRSRGGLSSVYAVIDRVLMLHIASRWTPDGLIKRLAADTLPFSDYRVKFPDDTGSAPLSQSRAAQLLTGALSWAGFRLAPGVTRHIVSRSCGCPRVLELLADGLVKTLGSPGYAGYSEMNAPPYAVGNTHLMCLLSDKNIMGAADDELKKYLFGSELKEVLLLAGSEKGTFGAEDLCAAARSSFEIHLTSVQAETILDSLSSRGVLSGNSVIGYSFASDRIRELLGNSEDIMIALLGFMEKGADV